MYRRRGVDEDDCLELVKDEDSVGDAESSKEGNFNSTLRLKEEKHNVPRPLSVLKLRIAAKTKSPKGKLLCWWITVALLGLVALIFVLVPLIIERGKRKGCSDYLNYTYGAVKEQPELPFFFQRDDGHFEICRGGESVLLGRLGINRSLMSEVKVNAYQDMSGAMLNITNLPGHEENCIHIAWTGTSSKQFPLQDCYQFGTDVSWYGAYEQQHQKWPINVNFSEPFSDVPFVPMDLSASGESTFGSILQPLWLSSVGVGILVDRGIQLHASMNSSHLCLGALPSHLECGPNLNGHTSLNYTICAFETVSQTAQFFLGASKMIARPNELPETSLFQSPLWTKPFDFTSTHFLPNDVVDACGNITSRLPISQLEIGNEYSLNFQNSLQSSDIDIDKLNNFACASVNLSVWVHPYVNYNSSIFAIGLRNDYYLPGQGNVNGNVVSLIKWSGDFGAVTNFLSADAKQNYENELNSLKNMSGVSSFNFHGGHYNYLPKCAYIDGLDGNTQSFTEAYVSFVSNQSYSKRSSVRAGFYTQDNPVFVRLSRNIAPNSSNDFSSLLSAVLSAGLGGYSFIIPELIAEFESCHVVNSTCFRLYIRWIELSTFFPVLHFTVMPLMFNNASLVQFMQSLSSLHEYMNFTRLAEDTIQSGYPIVRPLWWRGSDQRTLNISDQFYVGDHFMVAPILDAGSESRMVYFPMGSSYKLMKYRGLLPERSPCLSNGCNGGQNLLFEVTLYKVLIFDVV